MRALDEMSDAPVTAPYSLTGFCESLARIEAIVTHDGDPVTIITGVAPNDVSPTISAVHPTCRAVSTNVHP
jgi:hypothetical protein